MTPDWHEHWKSAVPEGVSGEWRVERFSVDRDASRWDFLTGKGRGVDPGRYTALRCHGGTVMSDTDDEYRDHCGLFRNARGHVLINGLGLGCALSVVRSIAAVERITVVEISADVLRLVAPTFAVDRRIEFVEADALTWAAPRGASYGAVWHDIWPNICSDNLGDMKALHRKYGRRAEWQGSWCRYQCERYAKAGC